jgi:putative hemolysin
MPLSSTRRATGMRMKGPRLCLCVALVVVAGCATEKGSEQSPNQMTQRAAEYCESVGGETEVQETSLGTGRYCRLPDGRVENQWQLYRSERLDND